MPDAPAERMYSYLALGDSYTIGEAVLITENFPYQTVQLLREKGTPFYAPEIIARTGWTTDELQAAIDKHRFLTAYDFVSLLIGVNNQYRGRSAVEYLPEFENLLRQAIRFAGGKADHVLVISIPDWGATPFAADRDRKRIMEEIDAYNMVNKQLAEEYGTHYIDITPGSREALEKPELVAEDKLHPSALEYKKWSKIISDLIFSSLAQ